MHRWTPPVRPRRRSRWTSEKRLAAKGVKYRYSGVDPGRGRDGQSTRVSRTAGSSELQLRTFGGLLPRQALHASSAQHRLPSPRPWHRRPVRTGWQYATRGPRRRPGGLGCGRRCAATRVIAKREQACRFIRVVKYFKYTIQARSQMNCRFPGACNQFQISPVGSSALSGVSRVSARQWLST